jgi:hypothetical protein
MKGFFRFLPLSLLLIVSVAGPALADRDDDGRCHKIHGTIVDVQVTEGCTSPNRFCAAGTVEGNHGLNGTTYFRMDGVVRGPATAPGSLATSGVLVYTTNRGTLTVRESGLSSLQAPLDTRVESLRVELFIPADAETAAWFRQS